MCWYLKKELQGKLIKSIRRRGKCLIFDLDTHVLISYLRMEGKYLLFSDAVLQNEHFHVYFQLDDTSVLVYHDVRKFGTFELMRRLEEFFKQRRLRPEPTREEFDLNIFIQQLSRSSKAIKSHLLDQTLVAGLGNIYVDEVLFSSKIHPEQMSRTLTLKQIKQLHKDIIRILQLAIEKKGSTIRTYRNALGEDGTMKNYLNVYGKTGQICFECGALIDKIKVGGRGTHFFPNCQVKS